MCIIAARLYMYSTTGCADNKSIPFRPQRKTETHLATIEAIYYFLREMDPLITGRYSVHDGSIHGMDLYNYVMAIGSPHLHTYALL